MKITQYFKDIYGELKHVNWPTREQTITYAGFVVGISLIVAYLLGAFDFLFSKGVSKILGL